MDLPNYGLDKGDQNDRKAGRPKTRGRADFNQFFDHNHYTRIAKEWSERNRCPISGSSNGIIKNIQITVPTKRLNK